MKLVIIALFVSITLGWASAQRSAPTAGTPAVSSAGRPADCVAVPVKVPGEEIEAARARERAAAEALRQVGAHRTRAESSAPAPDEAVQ
jgi:hypothetical protein